MKTTKFSFFFTFFLSFFLIEQAMAQELRCGTPPPSESQRAEIIRKLRINEADRFSSCTDEIDNSTKTYRLI
jgi:hypothetical protein